MINPLTTPFTQRQHHAKNITIIGHYALYCCTNTLYRQSKTFMKQTKRNEGKGSSNSFIIEIQKPLSVLS